MKASRDMQKFNNRHACSSIFVNIHIFETEIIFQRNVLDHFENIDHNLILRKSC